MTDFDGWEQQPGGLWLKASQYDHNNQEHRDAAMHVMRSTVQTIAKTHGASFSAEGFRNNMRAISSGDLEVDLYLAKWDICQPKSICVGAAFGWNTYYFTPDGQLALSEYTEDVCMPRSQLRQLIRTKPDEMDFPTESIASAGERIRLKQMQNDGIVYMFGEVDRDNTTMTRQLTGNGASLGTGADSAVLEFKRIPIDRTASILTPVSVHEIKRHGTRNERCFFVRWTEGQHDMRFMVVKGRATALGKPRADIFPWHNGNLPDQGTVQSVIASALSAIHDEVGERKWGNQQGFFPTPVIPLLTSRPDVYKALFGAAGDEIRIHVADHPTSFDKPVHEAHVFVQDDKRILDGFESNDARQRFFGNKPMIPGVNVLRGLVSGLTA